MKNPTPIVLASCLLLTLAAAPAPAQQKPAPSEPAAKPETPTAPNYRLSADDLIHIAVFQEDDMNTTARIAEDGTIAFPLIGNVKIGGMTVAEATKKIRDQLDAKYLVNPQVTMTVLLYANRKFTVLGQVQRPGTYNMREKGSLPLMQAIGMASGYTRLANAGKITIKRNTGGKDVVLELNGKKMANDSATATFVVLPGDTITVAERIF